MLTEVEFSPPATVLDVSKPADRARHDVTHSSSNSSSDQMLHTFLASISIAGFAHVSLSPNYKTRIVLSLHVFQVKFSINLDYS